ncbi:MAG: PspC domain-containing protein [Lachnospiraceae bacterium]|nr:PspC domain-containing protein [Lachnospiraceae bacterium]
MQKELRRSATDCKIFGVCGGIAEYFSIDSTLVRLIWVAVTLFAGMGLLLYIIAGILMPKADPMERDLKDVINPDSDNEAQE